MPPEGLVERLDGHPGGHLAADMATHAVGHGEQIRAASGRSWLEVRTRPVRWPSRSENGHVTSRTPWHRPGAGRPCPVGSAADLLGVDQGPVGGPEVLDPQLVVLPEKAGVEVRGVGVLGDRYSAASRAPYGHLVVEVVGAPRVLGRHHLEAELARRLGLACSVAGRPLAFRARSTPHRTRLADGGRASPPTRPAPPAGRTARSSMMTPYWRVRRTGFRFGWRTGKRPDQVPLRDFEDELRRADPDSSPWP